MESLQEWLNQPDGLARRLLELRARAEMTGKAVADANGWAPSKVSRIENGKQMPSEDDVRAWVATCRAPAETVEELLALRNEAHTTHMAFRSRMRQGQQRVQEDYNNLVENSTMVRHFETVFMPGLLQVPAYARRVLTEMDALHGSIGDVEEAVQTRMRRQQAIYDTSKRFEFLIAEPVLRWLLCPPEVMREQLDRLQTVIGLDRIRFGILPFGVELETTPQNGFQVYVMEQTLVVVETFEGENAYRDEKAAHHERLLDAMWEEAVTGDRARELIVAAARDLAS